LLKNAASLAEVDLHQSTKRTCKVT